ncbi:uncharacterized protein ALTATR162_LOCUS3049 [Alternaria atra]|uniref:Uncharacterized protein n=1 Tax=Alternaria atra TaxID=119953 RepID=A0A8J2HZJ0_9PLEO|nr:uncharacterized protein ALTATR162_LOCUS3049 [Alternaria atra]CAG5153138.1 unnamed protein product [Alternaria atra]
MTSQPARFSQPKRQIQHVVLLVVRLRHLVVVLLALDDDVAHRTRAGAAARAFHFKVVVKGLIKTHGPMLKEYELSKLSDNPLGNPRGRNLIGRVGQRHG